jgi:hypothetical protein
VLPKKMQEMSKMQESMDSGESDQLKKTWCNVATNSRQFARLFFLARRRDESNSKT